MNPKRKMLEKPGSGKMPGFGIREERMAAASVGWAATDKRQDPTFSGKAGRKQGYNTRKC